MIHLEENIIFIPLFYNVSSTDGFKNNCCGVMAVEILKLSNRMNSDGVGHFFQMLTNNMSRNSTRDGSAYSKCLQNCKCYKLKVKGITHVKEAGLENSSGAGEIFSSSRHLQRRKYPFGRKGKHDVHH